MANQSSRREFLGASGRLVGGAATLAVAGFPHPAIRTGIDSGVAANDMVGLALIGCGGMGRYNLADFLRAPEVCIAAVCDVDDAHSAAAAESVEKAREKKPKLTRDYRDIL